MHSVPGAAGAECAQTAGRPAGQKQQSQARSRLRTANTALYQHILIAASTSL